MDMIFFYVLAALGFGFVIFIHELGHFLFAKWAGVKVEVFSIGFGPRLLTWRWGETEYSLSLLPLGGYVRMVGQEDLPEDGAPVVNDPRSFTAVSPWWRALILLGGVLFNFLSSYALMLVLAFHGLPIIRPLVGDIRNEVQVDGKPVPSPAARLGVRLGDEIVTVNGERTRSFEDVVMAVVAHGQSPVELTVRRAGQLVQLGVGAGITPIHDPVTGLPSLGIQPASSAVLADPIALGRAQTLPPSAPRAGERMVAVGGTIPANGVGQEFERLLQPFYGQEVVVTLVDEAGATRQSTLRATAESDGSDGTLGLPVVIRRVVAKSPAAQAGLQPGDVVARIDETALCGTQHFLALVRTGLDRGERVALEVYRPGEVAPRRLLITGADNGGRKQIGVEINVVDSGHLPVLAPALDGLPSALAAAGIQAGDTLLKIESESRTRLKAVAVRGGVVLPIPMDAVTRKKLQTAYVPGKLAKLMGDKERQALMDQLAGTRVVAVADAEGRPVGSPTPGLIVVRTPDNTERTIDLRALGEATAPFIAALQAGDWLGGINPAGDAFVAVRGADITARAVILDGRPVGVPLLFDPGVTAYKLESPGEAFAIANKATHTMIVKSLQLIPKFFQSAEYGGVDASKSLQGPIGIFSELKRSAAEFGIAAYFKIVAFIGLNLVLVNLLPIPITDGGQLVFLAIETATGRTIPGKVRLILAYAGLAMVLSLMIFVTWLDIARRL